MTYSVGSSLTVSPQGRRFTPAFPPRAVRRKEALRQALRLPGTLLAIGRIVAEDYGIGALDEHLWAFRGFHDGAEDPHYRARQWRRVRLGEIGPGDVTGLAVWELAFMANVAREIEEPILDYSRQNGEGFRVLLPSLARFLGKNREAAAHAAAHGLPWCESPWCEEERRHATTFARVIEKLTRTSPGRENPNRPKVVTSSEADAVRLVITRQAAEWNSSSTYTVMAAHAAGDLHHLLRNVARDEVKHLAILAAADRYLFGPRPWRRLADIVRESLDEYRTHRRRRSGGDMMGTNPVTAFEVVAAHLLAERRVRRWLAVLPLRTLEAVFEAPSRVAGWTSPDESPESRAEREATALAGAHARASLSRWAPRAREAAVRRRAFETAHAPAIEGIVRTRLNGFRGAEAPGSRGDREARSRIRRSGGRMLRASLVARLRDHQVRNNRHVLAGRRT